MDDATPEEARAALDRAIEERPGEVVAFVERIERANDVLDTTSSAGPQPRRRSPADEFFDGLAETTNALFGAGPNGEPNAVSMAALAAAVGANAGDLERALRKLARLERDGTLAELADAGEALRGFEDRLGGDIEDLVEDANVAGDVGRLLRAVEAAGEGPERRLGVVGFAAALRDAEVQRGMGFLVALARELGREG